MCFAPEQRRSGIGLELRLLRSYIESGEKYQGPDPRGQLLAENRGDLGDHNLSGCGSASF
jgi:hypothetical protein